MKKLVFVFLFLSQQLFGQSNQLVSSTNSTSGRADIIQKILSSQNRTQLSSNSSSSVVLLDSIYHWDFWFTLNQMVLAYKIEYTYDSNGNLISQVRKNWNGTSWGYWNRYLFTYNQNNYLATSVYQIVGGSPWYNSDSVTYFYDANNNLISEERQVWNFNTWVNDEQYFYAYNSRSHLKNVLS